MTNATDPIALAGALLDPQHISQHWPAATAGLVFIVFALLAQSWLKVDPVAHVPVVGKGGKWARRKAYNQGQGPRLYADGYKQFKDSIFRITTSKSGCRNYKSTYIPADLDLSEKDTICVPPKYLPELKKVPDDVISFTRAIDESMQVKYTKMPNDMPILIHAIRASLTPALPRLNAAISDEVNDSMRLELPQSSTWTEVNINAKLLRIIAMASGRVFIGSELCRDERYLDASISYTIDLMTAVHVIALVPSFLRPLLASWLPTTKKLYKRLADAEAVFRPIVAARKAEAAAQREDDPGYREPDDMLQWILNAQDKFGALSDRELAHAQLGISVAAIHTTSMTTTNAVYWLAAKPDMIPMLRDDVQQALVESGGGFTSGALQNMKKLDSFLKEVMRCTPLSATSFTRKVLKDVTLPNGQTIPEGMFIEVPADGMNNDPDIFPDPHVFDPLRFYKLREAKELAAASGPKAAEVVVQAQFVSVGTTHLTFGYGKHACPGRFFAVNEIKMIIANILCNYEIRMPEGMTERYENLAFGSSIVPDPKKTIMIRKL
ncbi:cytochrome P450 [Colletotrichum orchidophilum]|uniref:Cytochrome P450 n=1 Tax=Colletotrichum orchidophilum TaxID=1209926 RepID=A0A1G4AP67_9PEZI|nr:cytochrome P450 [Colletotrichum orchidophilum]OHE90947.1 cytochrome P450 [Colletotrichum orchidophilum]